MSTNKHINAVAAVFMVFAVLLAAAFTVLSHSETAVSAFAYETECSYEDLFAQFEVMEVAVSIEDEAFQEMLENPTAEEYQTCDVTVNGKTYTNVAIRTKGNTSLSQVAASDSDRYSFKIEFDHYDSGQSLEGLDKLVLNNLFCDATYVKEYIAYDIFNFMGVACPYYSFAHITVNGEEWGLYLALEAMEDSFVERVYGTNESEMYKPESAGAGGGKPQHEEAPEGMEMPEGVGAPGGGEAPEGMEVPGGVGASEGLEMPEGAEAPESIGAPEAAEITGGESADSEIAGSAGVSAGKHTNGAAGRSGKGERGGFNFGGGKFDLGGSGGSDLVYTDDDADSYADIFDNASFNPTDEDKMAVIEALKNLSEGENLEQYFDVDACLRYFAAQTFIVNMDSYYSSLKHNYYLYEENGQLTILPWDLNLAFGGFQASGATDAVNSAIDTPMGGSLEESRPLFSKLMEVEEYQERYHQYLEEIVNGYVGSGQFQKTLHTVTAVIDSYVKADATAFYSYEEYTQAIGQLEQFVLLRAESVEAQLKGEIPATTEEQKDCENLIDASMVDLSVMGMQGGDGAGGKGDFGGNMFGRPGERREAGFDRTEE